VFGALLSGEGGLVHGLRLSLVLAAVVSLSAAAAALVMRPVTVRHDEAAIEGIAA
jgi:hypothetical protein